MPPPRPRMQTLPGFVALLLLSLLLVVLGYLFATLPPGVVVYEEGSVPLGQVETAAIFALLGAACLLFALRGRRRAGAIRRLLERHPDEPWRWRADWAEGRIPSENRRTLWGWWLGAVLATLLIAPQGILAALEGDPNAWVVLWFSPLLLWLWGAAIRGTLLQRRYGTPHLRLEQVPAVPGGRLAGSVEVPRHVDSRGRFKATLICWRKTKPKGRGNARSTRLFHEETPIHGERIRARAGTTVLPVAFDLPADAAPTALGETDRAWVSTSWKLMVEADVSGVDLSAEFEVPVFEGAAAAATVPAEGAAPLEAAAGHAPSSPVPAEPSILRGGEDRDPPAPTNPRLRYDERADGLEITLEAGYRARVAVPFFGMSGFAGAFAVGSVVAGLPVGIPAFLGVFAACTAPVGVLWALSSRRVVVEGGRLEVWSGIGQPRTRRRTIPGADVDEVLVREGGRSGKLVAWNVVARSGRGRVTLVPGLSEWLEAEWVAARIRRALGVAGRLTAPGTAGTAAGGPPR